MNIAAAIDDLLTGTPAVVASAPGGIHQARVPQDTPFPYVLFFRSSGRPSWSMDPTKPALQSDLWTVKAVDRGTSAKRARELAELIDQAMNNAPLDIPEGICLRAARETDVDMVEDDGAVPYWHRGGIYRVIAE